MNGKDARLLMIYNNINDPQFMEFIMFMRYFMMSGSPETFANMRKAEIQRKTQVGGAA
jgi:anthranilate/para-aminobenzoate synthase component I